MHKIGIAGILMLWLTGPCSVFGVSATNGTDWSHIPRTETFDVITWNIEWFGDTSRGPEPNLQFKNVTQIIDSLQPDLIGVQEIYSSEQFERLLDSLDYYDGFITNYGWGGDPDAPGLDVGFIYNTRTISHHSDRVISGYDFSAYDWAYRFPLEFEFQVRIRSTSYRMNAVVFHAKAASDQQSYDRRVSASSQIKNNYFDQHLLQVPLIYLGDYNDNMTGSIAGDDLTSPYQNFLEDPYYEVVTLPLEEAGEASWPGIGSRFDASMLDHITVNLFLAGNWLRGSEEVYQPDYISNYPGTTSDHYPVLARFDITGEATATAAEFGSGYETNPHDEYSDKQISAELLTNYPNPFNPSTAIPFHLEDAEQVTISVYNMLGQRVATPVRDQHFAAGSHTIPFEASHLSSGLYIYEMRLSSGYRMARTMQLVK